MRPKILILFLFTTVIFCQSGRDPLFDDVETYLDLLKVSSADIICADNYEKALTAYTEAKIMLNDGEPFNDIREELENSIFYITQINDVIDSRSDMFSEVLSARESALEQNADKYGSSDWINGEELFSEASEDAADGEFISARELIPTVVSFYNNAASNAERANELLYNWSPLKDANEVLANRLSPIAYSEGTSSFNDALDNLAEGDEKEDFNENLDEAKSSFEQSVRNANAFMNSYPSILEDREEAKVAGAENFALEYWLAAEKNLSNLGEMYEDGDFEDVLDERPEAENLFTTAKLEAVKIRILDQAKKKIETAYEADADDLAPITLNESESIYSQGIVLVESDNYTEEEVQKTADQSLAYADLAIRISETIKKSDDENPTWEKQILSWNTIPLELASSTSSFPLPTYKPQNTPAPIYETVFPSRVYDDIEEIFSDDEAEIKESDGVVVISLIGLNFKPVQTKVDNDNKYLMDKAIAAIKLFPNANISIIGHTDNASTKRFNKNLSERVANNVREYIINNSTINPSLISSEGHGEDEPIAENKTYEGRMKNRRVDVVIDY